MWLLQLFSVLILLSLALSQSAKPQSNSNPDLCSVCGIIQLQARIYNGHSSNYGPWSTYIEYNYGKKVYFCTGTIISYQHILTASHCFLANQHLSPKDKATSLNIFAGDTTKMGKNAQLLQAETVHMHPKFKYTKGDINSLDDVAIIKLKNPIELSNKIRPACIGDIKLYPDDDTLIQGYGLKDLKHSSNMLQEGNLRIQSDEECKRVYNKMFTPEHLCAKNGTRGACPGDSGGGLFKLNKGRQYVVGISSWGGNCDGFAGEAMVFTRVSSYLDWIKGITGNNLNCLKKRNPMNRFY